VLLSDNRERAVERAKEFKDPRVRSYWDPKRLIGKSLKSAIELPKPAPLAWDVYLLFDGKAKWEEAPPKPSFWMHQLAMDDRLLDGERLRKSLEGLLKKKPGIVFITREGCAGTPLMRRNLEEALRKRGGSEAYRTLDAASLDPKDPLTALGTPTVLVDGKDLLGAPMPTAPAPPS
jgi:hypothetical protein